MARPSRRRTNPPHPDRRGTGGGIPIEDAPWWVRAILAALLALIAFPALVGLLAGWGAWHGQRLTVALAAGALGVLIVLAVTRRRWQRPLRPQLHDPRPPLVRLATWLITALLYPNLLFGLLVLSHPERTLTYREATALGLLVSTLQAFLGWLERRRRRRAAPDAP